MNGKIVVRIVAGLILLGVIGGIAFFAFQAGVAQGSPVTVNGQSMPMPHFGYGYGMPYHHSFGFGLGWFGFILTLFLLFVAFKAFRVMMWGPRWGFGQRHGHWAEHGLPPMFEEWHKRAHGESTEEKKE